MQIGGCPHRWKHWLGNCRARFPSPLALDSCSGVSSCCRPQNTAEWSTRSLDRQERCLTAAADLKGADGMTRQNTDARARAYGAEVVHSAQHRYFVLPSWYVLAL